LHALAYRPLVDVRTVHRDVLANRPRLDADSVEVHLRDEKDLTAGRIGVGAALQAVTRDRRHQLARLGAAAPATRGDKKTRNGCHARSVSIESET
jgi:hypothetical protein